MLFKKCSILHKQDHLNLVKLSPINIFPHAKVMIKLGEGKGGGGGVESGEMQLDLKPKKKKSPNFCALSVKRICHTSPVDQKRIDRSKS